MGAKWTESEDSIIREHWFQEGSIRDFMHLLPGRSKQSIEKRGQALKLGGRKIWTKKQDARLREIWFSGGRVKSYMDEFPGHSLTSINQRAVKLGLGRRPKRGGDVEPIGWVTIKRVMTDDGMTCHALMDATGLHVSVVYKYLRDMHDAGQIHVANWVRKTRCGKLVPAYVTGSGQDAPKPAPMSNAEKERKYRKERNLRRAQSGGLLRGFNPFAVAAGLVSAPNAGQGRIYKQERSDELEAA